MVFDLVVVAICCEICRVLIWITNDKLFFHSLLEALACKFKHTFRNFCFFGIVLNLGIPWIFSKP